MLLLLNPSSRLSLAEQASHDKALSWLLEAFCADDTAKAYVCTVQDGILSVSLKSTGELCASAAIAIADDGSEQLVIRAYGHTTNASGNAALDCIGALLSAYTGLDKTASIHACARAIVADSCQFGVYLLSSVPNNGQLNIYVESNNQYMSIATDGVISTDPAKQIDPIDPIEAIYMRCAQQLPDEWRMTYSLTNTASAGPDVLMSVYGDDSIASESIAWNCTANIFKLFWNGLAAENVTCNKLTLILYDDAMAPHLSISVGYELAIGTSALISGDSAEFKASLLTLSQQGLAAVADNTH